MSTTTEEHALPGTTEPAAPAVQPQPDSRGWVTDQRGNMQRQLEATQKELDGNRQMLAERTKARDAAVREIALLEGRIAEQEPLIYQYQGALSAMDFIIAQMPTPI